MSDLLVTLSVLGFFVIRLGIPFALLILVSYTLYCLDAAWRKAAVTS